ncbi:MAG: serine/threonine-protein kinase [Sandaracinaceae bacterium]
MTRQVTTEGGEISLVQHRVARLCLVFGMVNFATAAVRAVMVATGLLGAMRLPLATIPAQLLSGVALVSVTAFLFRTPRTPRQVRVAEALGLLTTAFSYEGIAYQLTTEVIDAPPLHRMAEDPESAVFAFFAVTLPLVGASFVLTYVMIVRAALVPTRARHTAILTSLVGAPLGVIAYMAGHGPHESYLLSPALLALGGVMQWAFTVLICAAVSHVIYGLREEVREAQRLGQYTLESLIGEGGMGMVYRASHLMLRRPTAIKLLPPDRAGHEALTRFEREVRLTAQLTHPNTVTIFDYGRTADGVFYYAMELLDGATLDEVVAIDGPQPPERVARILEQVAGALSEAHAVGLIHRDIKPANIVLCRQGGELDVAKVVDFGLVKEVAAAKDTAVSRDGTISGTPLYMAPEILKASNAASPRSDLYALGAVAYFLLTGEHVFSGESVIEVLGHHLHTEPEPPPSRLGESVCEPLESLIMRCLEKDPAARPADMVALRRAVEQCHVGRWTQRSARNWWDAYASGLAERRSRAPVASPKTKMAVDVDSRAITLDP